MMMMMIIYPLLCLDPVGFNNDLMSHLFNHLNELSTEYPRVPGIYVHLYSSILMSVSMI